MQIGQLTRHLIRTNALGPTPLTLIDVGCSGGIDPQWFEFGAALQAYGFDVLLAEVERLNAIRPNSCVEYIAGLVGAPSGQSNARLKPKTSNIYDNMPPVYARTSAAFAMQLSNLDYTVELHNQGQEALMSDRRLTIDDFCAERALTDVDFIKIDTDGCDFDVLLGLQTTLATRNVLGLLVEIQFHGPATPNANVFSNIDHLLRNMGFTLFDLEVNRYTRSALPGKFRRPFPAQTVGGQVIWGDALYLRDFAEPACTAGRDVPAMKPETLLKMLMLFELYGLHDCAIELLQTRKDLIHSNDFVVYRDILASNTGVENYDEYINLFVEACKKYDYATFPNGRVIRGEGVVEVNPHKPAEVRLLLRQPNL